MASTAVQPVRYEVPPEQESALSADIQVQLAGLPTAITDAETCRRAKESLPVLKRAEDKVVAFFKDIKDAAFKSHRLITSKESAQLKPIAQARQQLSSLIYLYEQEQERLRRQAERDAAEREQQRRQAEALEEAAALSTDHPEVAEQILAAAIAAPAPVVTLPAATVEVAGVGSRANWKFRFAGCGTGVEFDKLPQADRDRVMRLLPREYLRPDERAIGAVVKAMKAGTRIPGVEVYDAGTLMVRG